jgi:hypothetical protein
MRFLFLTLTLVVCGSGCGSSGSGSVVNDILAGITVMLRIENSDGGRTGT